MKNLSSQLFFGILFAITWTPAILLHDTNAPEWLVVSLYLSPFAVFFGMLIYYNIRRK
jgi:hypothetical protein